MSTVKALGDQWERELLDNLHQKRNGYARQAERCNAGGEYQAQILRIVAMHDRMIAALAQPIQRGAMSNAEIDAILVKHGKGDDGFHAFARAILAAQADTNGCAQDSIRPRMSEQINHQQGSAMTKKRFNWLDMLAYRLYYWRWRPIYERDIELVKIHIKWMQEWVDGQERAKERQ